MDEATASGYKICNLCGKPKPLDEFPFRSDGLKRRPRCRICIVKTANGSQAAREAQDRFHKVHPDKRAEYFARWREANPDYSYEKQLRETDPDKYRTLVDARNARRRLLTSEPCKHEACSSGINRRAVWGRDEGHCRIKLVCDGDFVPFEEMHMDHVVPLSKGGLHCYYNVQTGCAPCNLAKSNRILEVVGLWLVSHVEATLRGAVPEAASRTRTQGQACPRREPAVQARRLALVAEFAPGGRRVVGRAPGRPRPRTAEARAAASRLRRLVTARQQLVAGSAQT